LGTATISLLPTYQVSFIRRAIKTRFRKILNITDKETDTVCEKFTSFGLLIDK